MLVADIQTAARDLYNGVGDSFFSDTQINNWMTQACNELARDCQLIETLTSTSTIALQQDYTYASINSLMIDVVRVVIRGRKIKRITRRMDDSVTLSNQLAQQAGIPVYYTDFRQTISLRPYPDDVYNFLVYSYDLHTPITNTTTLTIPTLFHFDLVDYILMRMFQKDKDIANVQLHKALWDEHIAKCKSWRARQKRADAFTVVQDEETLPVTILGEA